MMSDIFNIFKVTDIKIFKYNHNGNIKKQEGKMRIFIICLCITGFLFGQSENTDIVDNNFGSLKVEKLMTNGVPMKFNIQGFLATSSGTPVTGNKNITFKIIKDNLAVYSEPQSVKCTLGIFSATIGNIISIPLNIFEGGDRWQLEVWIDDAQLQPAIEITSSAFAFKSIKCDTANYVLGSTSVRPITPPICTAPYYNEIANNAIATNMIQNNAIDSFKVHDNAITNNKIRNDAISSIKIQNDAVTTSKIQNNAIDSFKVHDNAITNNKIRNDAISSIKIQDGAITTAKIEDNAIITNKIANDQITSFKIKDSAVTFNKIKRPFYLTGMWEIIGDYSSNPAVSIKKSTHSALGIEKFQDDNDYALQVTVTDDHAEAIYTNGLILAHNVAIAQLTSRGNEALFTLASPEEEFYSNGSAQLKNGIVNISFDRLFSEGISSEILVRVIVTPVGSWSGMYVENTLKDGFTVKSDAGDLNAKFNWIAIGRRKGSESRPVVSIPNDETDEHSNEKNINNNQKQ